MAHFVGSSADAQKIKRLEKEREDQRKRIAEIKQNLVKDAQVGLRSMDDAFTAQDSRAEAEFKAHTVGLVSAEDFRKKRQWAEEATRREEQKREQVQQKQRQKKEAERKAKLSALSFDVDEEEATASASVSSSSSSSAATTTDSNTVTSDPSASTGSESDSVGEKRKLDATDSSAVSADSEPKKKKLKKDPTVDTYFLPDKEREHEEEELKKQLEKEYKEQQEKIKAEMIEVTYSYWDGSGHRRAIKVSKGTRMDQFLEKCRRDLCEAFHELRGVTNDNMMYIKEDLIIPHHYTFYDLIITKARGKSGPLFHFDVHDDVRLVQDARIEKDESHAGKIVTRGWYERNKHIFPASRWEVYDPSKTYERYTIK